jgi:hypothetical protein
VSLTILLPSQRERERPNRPARDGGWQRQFMGERVCCASLSLSIYLFLSPSLSVGNRVKVKDTAYAAESAPMEEPLKIVNAWLR